MQNSPAGETMNQPTVAHPLDRDAFEALLGELRPKLHRFCARMTGSVIDGEDVVQDALAKAVAAFPGSAKVSNYEAWLFRIAHNAAVDFLRRRARDENARADTDPDTIVDERIGEAERREIAAAGLRTFMRLPVVQRSAVLLMDVFGHSLRDVSRSLDITIPAVKAALHRGRTRLRALAREPDDVRAPLLAEPERSLLHTYTEHFNVRNFDAIRNMLADEVKLELVNRTRFSGRAEVGTYFGNYAALEGWRLTPGVLEGRPAALVSHGAPSPASYFILFEFRDGTVAGIRDFVHAQYITDGAQFFPS
ncbi:MAG: polymerase subunit sigma-70 [Candidatus Eremiobacteraeota bacterium]|nr:polymerase subunit sigma-70 [Candidatus Eremiobacteraeota bacterium]